MANPNNFVWYELMTSDLDAAKAFYKTVVGWNAEAWGGAGMPYVILKAGDAGVAGMMTIPEDAAKMGVRPGWVGYIGTPDVDAATRSVKEAGGTVHREPDDIPEVGRFSVVADPQGAMFILLTPTSEDKPPESLMTPGQVGWRELYASDWQSAFAFYSGQFGWTKGDAVDMGEMGIYQLFAAGGDAIGGMMTKPADVPAPNWLFYFNVTDIDAAVARVTENKGQVVTGPMEVPGGAWIIQAMDPQGAMFALVGSRN
jgi:predicted enzyme related to lactoylglutathione lyase